MDLAERSVVQTREDVFGEKERWVDCDDFGKWKGNEREGALVVVKRLN